MLTEKQIQAFIDEFGPYLYHATERDPHATGEQSLAQGVQERGLAGNDAYHPQPSVYLSAQPNFISGAHEDLGVAMFRVKIEELDPQLLEADEWQLMEIDELFADYDGEAGSLDEIQLKHLKTTEATWTTLTGNGCYAAVAYRGDIAPEILECMDDLGIQQTNEFDEPLVIGEEDASLGIDL